MISKKQVDQRVQDFVDACRQQGIKATHQRMEILRELAGTVDHPDAETLYKSVRLRLPSLSLDTVYRTLRMFEERGIISRVGSTRDRARFDANTDRHHHFICTRCGCISDFYSDALDQFNPPSEVSEMGKTVSVYVELRGVCKKCQKLG